MASASSDESILASRLGSGSSAQAVDVEGAAVARAGSISWTPDIRALRAFALVAEVKSVTKAAQKLAIAQPALSRQIRRLEEDLGVRLFERSSRGVTVTDAGAALLLRAERIFNQLDETFFEVSGQTHALAGTVTIGMPPTPGEAIAPVLVERANSRYPDLELRFVERFSDTLERMIVNGEIAVAVMHDPPPHPDLTINRLLDEHLWLVGKAGSLGRDKITLAEACRLPLVMPSRPNFIRRLIDKNLAPGATLNIVQRVDGLGQLRALLRHGHGFTALTYGAVVSDIKLGRLEAAMIVEPQVSWTLAVARRNEPSRRAALAAVTGLIGEITGEFVANGLWR